MIWPTVPCTTNRGVSQARFRAIVASFLRPATTRCPPDAEYAGPGAAASSHHRFALEADPGCEITGFYGAEGYYNDWIG
mgnify:CR=1 FL=1